MHVSNIDIIKFRYFCNTECHSTVRLVSDETMQVYQQWVCAISAIVILLETSTKCQWKQLLCLR